jgi:hypothetical protein
MCLFSSRRRRQHQPNAPTIAPIPRRKSTESKRQRRQLGKTRKLARRAKGAYGAREREESEEGGRGQRRASFKIKGMWIWSYLPMGRARSIFLKAFEFWIFWFFGVPRRKGNYMRTPLGIIPGANPRANARPCLPAFHLVRRRRQFRDLDFGLIQSWPSHPAGPAGQVFPRESRFFKSYQAQVKTDFKHLNVLLFYFSHSTSSIPSNFVCCCMWEKKHTHKYIHTNI